MDGGYAGVGNKRKELKKRKKGRKKEKKSVENEGVVNPSKSEH